jgi:hypothetical protein
LTALLALAACSSTRVSSVAVPPPHAPFALALTVSESDTVAVVSQVIANGLLEVVEAERPTGRLLLGVRDGSRLVTLALSRAFDPALVADWRGLAVHVEATVAPEGTDLELTEAEGQGLLLLVVSRRFADRLPGKPDQWGTPADLPLRRVAGASTLRTTGDENDCVALSVHYPLEVVGGPAPLRLDPDTWAPATWRGRAVGLLNHEAWWYRRSTCPTLEGAGFTVIVRALPQTPLAKGPNTTL